MWSVRQGCREGGSRRREGAGRRQGNIPRGRGCIAGCIGSLRERE